MDNWIKVERGVRYREHPTRKHGVPRRPDRYYVIRLAVDGVMRQEALGWESEGVTLEKARLELARLREAKRTGKGPRSLAEKREINENRRKADEEARRTAEVARTTVAEFWQNSYWPAQGHSHECHCYPRSHLFFTTRLPMQAGYFFLHLLEELKW